MADNTLQNATETIRTDDRVGGSVKTQVFIPDIGAEGEAELLGLGDSRIIVGTSAGLTTASTVYSAGDTLGTEISLTSIVRTGKGSVIQSASLIDKAKVLAAPGVDGYLFAAASTPAADNAVNAWADANMLDCLGIIHFSDLVASANNFTSLGTNLPIVVKPTSGTTVFLVLVTRAGHSFFGAAGDLVVNLGVIRD